MPVQDVASVLIWSIAIAVALVGCFVTYIVRKNPGEYKPIVSALFIVVLFIISLGLLYWGWTLRYGVDEKAVTKVQVPVIAEVDDLTPSTPSSTPTPHETLVPTFTPVATATPTPAVSPTMEVPGLGLLITLSCSNGDVFPYEVPLERGLQMVFDEVVLCGEDGYFWEIETPRQRDLPSPPEFDLTYKIEVTWRGMGITRELCAAYLLHLIGCTSSGGNIVTVSVVPANEAIYNVYPEDPDIRNDYITVYPDEDTALTQHEYSYHLLQQLNWVTLETGVYETVDGNVQFLVTDDHIYIEAWDTSFDIEDPQLILYQRGVSGLWAMRPSPDGEGWETSIIIGDSPPMFPGQVSA